MQQDREANQRLGEKEQDRAGNCYLTAWNRAGTGPGDDGVEVAIDDVVIGAAGAAHCDRADQKQHHVANAGIADPKRIGGERRRPPGGQQQQPPADRPVPSC